MAVIADNSLPFVLEINTIAVFNEAFLSLGLTQVNIRQKYGMLEDRHLSASDLSDTEANLTAEDSDYGLPATQIEMRGFIFANRSTALLAHPLMWIAAGTLVFLVAWFFPPSLYSEFYGEESRVFFDLKTLVFSACCIACTCAGVWLGMTGRFFDAVPRVTAGTDLMQTPVTRIGLLLLMIAANLTSIALYVRVGGLAALLASLRGQSTLNKELIDVVENSGGMLWIAALMGPSAFVPLAYQLFRSQPNSVWTRRLVVLFFVTYVVAALLASRRSLFAAPMLGLLIVYLAWPSHRGLTRLRAISVCLFAATIILVLFLGLGAIRRGWQGPQDIVSEPLRYLITPYNTQALMINGELSLPGALKGYYWTEWIWKFPLVDNILHLEENREKFLGERALHGAQERYGVLKSQGVSTATSLPAFACSYFDFGWLGPLPFFFTGWIAGFSWRGFLKGSSCQILLFPVIAYSFVEWRSNLLFPSLTSDYVLMLIAVIKLSLFFELKGHQENNHGLYVDASGTGPGTINQWP